MDTHKSFEQLESELRARSHFRNQSPLHRYMQEFVQYLGQKRGFEVFLEKNVLDNTGYVDVSLERPGLTVAVEISVTTSPTHEAQNLSKCLSAGYTYVVLLSSNEHKLIMARAMMGEEEQDRTRFLNPAAFVGFIDELLNRDSGRKRRANDKNVKVVDKDEDSAPVSSEDCYLTTTDTSAYLGVAVQTLAKWRWAGSGPTFYKVGRGVLYKKSELKKWM